MIYRLWVLLMIALLSSCISRLGYAAAIYTLYGFIFPLYKSLSGFPLPFWHCYSQVLLPSAIDRMITIRHRSPFQYATHLRRVSNVRRPPLQASFDLHLGVIKGLRRFHLSFHLMVVNEGIDVPENWSRIDNFLETPL